MKHKAPQSEIRFEVPEDFQLLIEDTNEIRDRLEAQEKLALQAAREEQSRKQIDLFKV